MASGEVFAPSVFLAVASESNQRFGVFPAAAGSAITRFFQRMNSPMDPVLYAIYYASFVHRPLILAPKVVEQLHRARERVRPPGICLGAVPVVVGGRAFGESA